MIHMNKTTDGYKLSITDSHLLVSPEASGLIKFADKEVTLKRCTIIDEPLDPRQLLMWSLKRYAKIVVLRAWLSIKGIATK